MRRLLLIPAVLLVLVGLVFTLQGTNVIKGSALMSGQSQWAVIGLILIIVGLIAAWFGLAPRRNQSGA